MPDQIYPNTPLVIFNPELDRIVTQAVNDLWKQVINSGNWSRHSDTTSFAAALRGADQSWRDMITNLQDDTLEKYDFSKSREYLKDAFIATAINKDWPLRVTNEGKLHVCRSISTGFFSKKNTTSIQSAVDTLKNTESTTPTAIVSKVQITNTVL